jgi:hypothetical protein
MLISGASSPVPRQTISDYPPQQYCALDRPVTRVALSLLAHKASPLFIISVVRYFHNGGFAMLETRL